MQLAGIEVWDGRTAIGVCDLVWSRSGADARFDAVVGAQSEPAFAGLSVIPGLIDTHVHVVGFAGGSGKDFFTWPLMTPPEEQVLHGLAQLRRGLQGGVTTVRDLASEEMHLALRAGINDGVVVGPRLVTHGVVGMTAGHNDLFTPVNFPVRKRTADGPDECRKQVRTWARLGMDGIKVTTGGGVLSQGDKNEWRNYSPAELDTIVDEAHALGMPVAAHAHTEAAIEAALRHGADSIEHGTLITADQADRAVERGVSVAPTLLINEAIANRTVPVSDDAAEKAKALVDKRNERLRVAADAGVDFVLGTDANGFHVAFGDQMAEVRRMAEIFGWGAERALQSATSSAARAIGRAEGLGTVASGFAADFLVVRGRPWEQLSALDTENIVAVVSRGEVVHGSLPVA